MKGFELNLTNVFSCSHAMNYLSFEGPGLKGQGHRIHYQKMHF